MPHVPSVPTGTPRVRGPPVPTTPHPCLHPHARSTPYALSTPMVGRDLRDAPRPWNAHGDATCTRAAGDVGPYHASPMSTPHALSTPMVGRDVLGAPRPRDAHGNATCTRAAEDVGPYHASPMFTPPRPVRTLRPVHTHGRARRPRRAAPTGRPRNAHRDAHGNATCTRAAGDVGPYHASRPVHTPRPIHTHWRVTMSGGGLRISAVSVRSF